MSIGEFIFGMNAVYRRGLRGMAGGIQRRGAENAEKNARRLRVDGDCDDYYEKENYDDYRDLPGEIIFKSRATC
jgi:hypothetical protein